MHRRRQVTAAALGVTGQWLARVELGTGNPDLRQVFALCDHLGLHLTALPSGSPAAAPVPGTVAPTTRPAGSLRSREWPGQERDRLVGVPAVVA
jgi:transcriptional regulator with XRE-family HTH domain